MFRRGSRQEGQRVEASSSDDEEVSRTGTENVKSESQAKTTHSEHSQSKSESHDTDSWKANLDAQGDSEAWEAAREKTLAAKNEAATAQLAGKKARHEAKEAEQASIAVQTARAKHTEALEEANKLEAALKAPSGKEGDLTKARELHTKKRAEADDLERALREAEQRLAAVKAQKDELTPQIQEQAEMVPSLEKQYQGKQRERKEAEGEVRQLATAAQNVQKTRTGLAGDLDKLKAELEKAEERTAAKQREYMESRNASQALSKRFNELKAKLRATDEELDTKRGQAQDKRQDIPAIKEAEEKALKDLNAAKAEWQRLKKLEEDQARAVADAVKRVEELQKQNKPASTDMATAERALKGKQDDLEQARQRAAEAQQKYDNLQHLAEVHAKEETEYAEASRSHTKNYEEFKEETSIHSSKHDQYWKEAKQLGDKGNASAFEAENELVEKGQVQTSTTQINGASNVPPNLSTPSSGSCTITINGNAGRYAVVINNIQNLQAVHLHRGSLTSPDIIAGNTTAALITLFTIPTGTPSVNQMGDFTTSNFNVNGSLANQPLSALATLISQGQVYCDVHAPPPTPNPTNLRVGNSTIRGQLAVTQSGPAPTATLTATTPPPGTTSSTAVTSRPPPPTTAARAATPPPPVVG
ncbi:hypothetical protein WJX73_000947 [Symbiochloris irregularis]|uniref:CHRD domain-containing protein n=1 Tax=Symbiochloris irregularis TaxID=706552 RepID=A0AAW1NWX7_9CHLO